jgi:hypothetical protein
LTPEAVAPLDSAHKLWVATQRFVPVIRKYVGNEGGDVKDVDHSVSDSFAAALCLLSPKGIASECCLHVVPVLEDGVGVDIERGRVECERQRGGRGNVQA